MIDSGNHEKKYVGNGSDHWGLLKHFTLPETNIAPENRILEKEIPIAHHHF